MEKNNVKINVLLIIIMILVVVACLVAYKYFTQEKEEVEILDEPIFSFSLITL